MRTRTLLLALTGLSITTAAQADESRKWYVSGAVGVSFTQDADFVDTASTGDFEIDETVNVAVAAGRQITDNIRAELELSYRDADIDTFNVVGTGSASVDGDLQSTALLVNGYYDFRAGKKFRPYLSAGAGIVHHDGEVSGGGVTLSDNDTVFAYQLGAGASYAIADNTSLFGGYRYLGSSDPEFDTLEAEYNSHELRLGIRYQF